MKPQNRYYVPINVNIDVLIKDVHCPFAKKALLGGQVNWIAVNNAQLNLASISIFIDAHLRSIKQGLKSDGLIIKLPGECFESEQQSSESLKFVFKSICEHLGESNTFDDRKSKSWRFTLKDIKHFVGFFAPFYEAGHAKYSGHPKVAWLIFQPQSSFKRVWETTGITREKAAQMVNAIFIKRKHTNPTMLTDYQKILVPKDLNKKPIDWW